MLSQLFAIQAVFVFLSFILITESSQKIDNGAAESGLVELEKDLCSVERKWPDQPILKASPVIRKCCSDNENLYIINSTIENFGCNRNNYPIVVDFSIVELYEDCIHFRKRSGGEITVNSIARPIHHEFFPCMFYGDMFGSHIIQNGSLLVTNTYGHFFYRINNDFCIDANGFNGAYMVCHDDRFEISESSNKSESMQESNFTQKFFTIVSIPCFIGVALLYIIINELRNLHGLYIISLTIFMTIEYILRVVLNALKTEPQASHMRNTIQYFDLMNHFWILVMFSNTVLFVWIYLPYKKVEWRFFAICTYGVFFICCLFIPTIISNRLKENEIKNLADFFTTPKTSIVLTYILLLITTFMGSNRLTKLIKKEILEKYYQSPTVENHDIELQHHHYELEEVENRLTCLTSLTGWMIIMRIFYIPGHYHLIMIRGILKSLQGIAFVLIFIVLRHKEIRSFVTQRFKR